MTDFEFILTKCKKNHFMPWNEEDLMECLEILPSLERNELLRLYRSPWVDDGRLKKEVLNVLFADKIGKREERIKNLPTGELIEEFKERRSGNIALIRKELRERFKQNRQDDRRKITLAFNASIKADQQWVKIQIRKESTNYRY